MARRPLRGRAEGRGQLSFPEARRPFPWAFSSSSCRRQPRRRGLAWPGPLRSLCSWWPRSGGGGSRQRHRDGGVTGKVTAGGTAAGHDTRRGVTQPGGGGGGAAGPPGRRWGPRRLSGGEGAVWAPAGVAAELAAAGSLESPGRFQSARRRLLRSCEALGKVGGDAAASPPRPPGPAA